MPQAKREEPNAKQNVYYELYERLNTEFILDGEKIPKEWRKSVLMLMFVCFDNADEVQRRSERAALCL